MRLYLKSYKNKDDRRTVMAVKAIIQSYISIFEIMVNRMGEPFLSQHVNVGLSVRFPTIKCWMTDCNNHVNPTSHRN
jgi:hypothetical protein